MGIHANAKLGAAGRRELAGLIRAGLTETAAGAWALDCSSRRHGSPRRTVAAIEQHVCEERRGTGWAHALRRQHRRRAT